MNIKIKPKSEKSKNYLGTPKSIDKVDTHNLEKQHTGKQVQLNFRVPVEFKRDYQRFALNNSMGLVEVLKESYKLYKKLKQ